MTSHLRTLDMAAFHVSVKHACCEGEAIIAASITHKHLCLFDFFFLTHCPHLPSTHDGNCAQVHSIYSPLYVSDRGLLVFDQIPWFKVAERLEAEKEMMLEERRRFQEMLDQQQVRLMQCCFLLS